MDACTHGCTIGWWLGIGPDDTLTFSGVQCHDVSFAGESAKLIWAMPWRSAWPNAPEMPGYERGVRHQRPEVDVESSIPVGPDETQRLVDDCRRGLGAKRGIRLVPAGEDGINRA